jgi:hypothetical protein
LSLHTQDHPNVLTTGGDGKNRKLHYGLDGNIKR